MVYQIANTFFELELLGKTPSSIEQSFSEHPLFFQLQFLSLLYANVADKALLVNAPERSFLQTHPVKIPEFSLITEELDPTIPIESWGPSPTIAAFARERGLCYPMPPESLIGKIHSKEFAFSESQKLPNAQIIDTEEKLIRWHLSFPGKKVLKTCFGTAGRGHFFLNDSVNPQELHKFTREEWSQNRPIIGEPWVERLLDFSTQWRIEQAGNIQYLGATVCGNTKRGQYGYTLVGKESELFDTFLPFLQEHLTIARPLIKKIQSLGWFGHLGIDAFVYKAPDPKLHPIVEVNARKTMGYVALSLQKTHYPDEILEVSYRPYLHGLLPSYFRKNLRVEMITKKDVLENRKTCLQL